MLIITLKGYKGDRIIGPDADKLHTPDDLALEIKQIMTHCDHRDCFTECDRPLAKLVKDETECEVIVVPDLVTGTTKVISYTAELFTNSNPSFCLEPLLNYSSKLKEALVSLLRERFPQAIIRSVL